MRSYSGTAAISAIQPIATYRPVDHSGCCRRLNSLAPTPSTAAAVMAPNSVQPQGPRSTPNKKGM
ncbi:hypothetical protein D9M69_732090 [compost metagenome]